MNNDFSRNETWETIKQIVDPLFLLCFEDPDKALQKIDELVREKPELKGSHAIHSLYAVAYGGKAHILCDEDAAGAQIQFLCEKSLSEFRLALDTATYEEVETYQEEIIVKPGGFFRKPQTEMVTKTRKVKKHRTDFRPFEEQMDSVAEILEGLCAGRVQEILGFTKIKYLGAAGRVSATNWAEDLTTEDWSEIKELTLSSDFIIRTIYFIASSFNDGLQTLEGFLYDEVVEGDARIETARARLEAGKLRNLKLVKSPYTQTWQVESITT